MNLIFEKYKLLLLLVIFFIANNILISQQNNNDFEQFYFDAIVFEGKTADSGRVDCFIVVPYDRLNFISVDDKFSARYQVELSAYDSSGTKVYEEIFAKNIRADNYFSTKGGNGEFDFTQKILFLPEGKYRIKAVVLDILNKQQYERSRNLTVINFRKFDMALSGILLLSAIEEVNGKYKITPHISDNIGNINRNFFVFFETYLEKPKHDSIDLIWEILDSKEELIAQGIRKRIATNTTKQQQFLQIPPIDEMTTGSYLVRVIALKPDTTYEYSSNDFLAVAQRSIKYIRSFSGIVMGDINTSVKQLRYVAYQSDIDFIQAGKNNQEKLLRFEQFWKKLDPTPTTERNEAFDEYFLRIEFANRNFRSYTEGWLTDKGMVYIVFGPPTSVERQQGYGDGKVYERWSYSNNREFIFADNTGFGDFRLYRPLSVTEKFQYNR